MASLASVTFELRLFIKIGVGILISLITIFLIYSGGIFIKEKYFPDPPPPPNMALGRLPQFTFPSQTKSNIGFNVNTKSGELPALPTRAKVYQNKPFEPSLTALQDARSKIENLRFTNSEEKISDTIFKWTKDTGETISMDIYSKNFTVDSNFIYFPEQYAKGSFDLTKQKLQNSVTTFLSTLDIDISDFDFEATRIRYYKITNGSLEQVESQNDAQIARIDLFQKNIEDIPILYPEYNGSTMHFFIGARLPGSELIVLKAEFYKHTPDIEKVGTYPIIEIQNALDNLNKGGGIVLSEKPLVSQTFQITNVSLAYYYSKEDFGFLYPVYVFYGSDFSALVSALAPESISNETN